MIYTGEEGVMGGVKIMMIVIMQIIITALALPCVAGEKVSFRHQFAKPSIFKLDCLKIEGKYDTSPTYICSDEKGSTKKFDPGKEWEEVTIESFCARHKVRANIRGCLKIQGKQRKTTHYGCVDAKGDIIPFAPDNIKWEMLEASHMDCQPHVREIDVPRGTTQMKINSSDGSDNGE